MATDAATTFWETGTMSAKTTQIEQGYWSVSDAAAYTGCSRKFVTDRISDGRLTSYLVGGRRFTTKAAIDEMILAGKNRKPRKGRGIRRNATAAASV